MEIARTSLNKVPEVTIVFWIIKIMSTTVGETGADYLAVHVGDAALTIRRSSRNNWALIALTIDRAHVR